jgi:hypothetical protein
LSKKTNKKPDNRIMAVEDNGVGVNRTKNLIQWFGMCAGLCVRFRYNLVRRIPVPV